MKEILTKTLGLPEHIPSHHVSTPGKLSHAVEIRTTTDILLLCFEDLIKTFLYCQHYYHPDHIFFLYQLNNEKAVKSHTA